MINAPFKVTPQTTVDTPFWKQPELLDLLRAAGVPVGLAIVALLVFFGVLRPSLKLALAPPAVALVPSLTPVRGSTLTAVVDDPQVLPVLPAPMSAAHLQSARALARDNPAAVAGIVRTWVHGEAGPG